MDERTDGASDGFDREVERAWRGFQQVLADGLADLEPGQAVHVALRTPEVDDDPAYVVAVRGHGASLRLEAGNGDPDPQEMLDLGWGLPRFRPAGEAVHELVEPARAVDRLAALCVRTLREVHGCLHPALLEVDGLAGLEDDGVSVPWEPEAEEPLATVPRDDEHLADLVWEALRPMVDHDLASDGGTLMIPVSDDAVVQVRLVDDEPAVEIGTEVLRDVIDLDRLPLELDLLNKHAAIGRYFLWDTTVLITHRVVAMPFAPVALRGTVAAIAEEVARSSRDLQARVGGRLPLDLEAVAPRRPLVPLHPGVVAVAEMLLDDADLPVETVAHVFGHDRHELVRQLVAVRRDDRGLAQLGGVDVERLLALLRRALRLVADREAGVRPPPGGPLTGATGATGATPEAGGAKGGAGYPQESLKKPHSTST